MTTSEPAPLRYILAHAREQLAADPDVAALDLELRVVHQQVFLSGSVQTEAQRDHVGAVVAELMPELEVHNEIVLTECPEPRTEPEQLT